MTCPPGRRLLQISMRPDMYEALRRHCQQLDKPMAIWTRDLIIAELAKPTSTHP